MLNALLPLRVTAISATSFPSHPVDLPPPPSDINLDPPVLAQTNLLLPAHSMYFSVALTLASALTAAALPQTPTPTASSDGYLNPAFSSADLVAIDSIIDALNSYAVSTATPSGAVTRTAEGFVSMGTGYPTFTDIAVRATSSAVQTVTIPDLDLEIVQYINPIQSNSKREVLERGQLPMDVCP